MIEENKVNLVSVTMPRIKGINTPDEFISYVARVSNPSNQMNLDTAEKLINYCLKKRHWSVFETINLGIEINTTRDIGRQILRHGSFKFQEFSQRYADPTKVLGFTLREARLQDNKNRQNSIETDDVELQKTWNSFQDSVIRVATTAYEWAVKNNIAKEQARVVLPEGLTNSRMYLNGTLRSWITYVAVREKTSETQKEHVMIARECKKIICEEFPSIKNALGDDKDWDI